MAGPRQLSFAEAVELAVQRAPSLEASRTEIDIRDLELANSYSAFFPQFDVSATHGLRDRDPSAVASQGSLASELRFQLTENLYDNGVSLTGYRSAGIQKEIVDLGFRNRRDEFILELALEYMRYSLAHGLADVQVRQFEIISKQYSTISNQYRQGVKTRRDYIRFKAELRRAEIALLASRTSVKKSRVELLRLLGFGPADSTEVLAFLPIEIQLESVTQVPAKAPALEGHYRYRISTLQKKLLDNELDLARRKYWPELFLTADATYRVGDYLGTDARFLANGSVNEAADWSALATVKFNLLDWGVRRRNVSIAEARRLKARADIKADLDTFAADNAKLMLDLEQSSKDFKLARELLELETANYAFLDTQYRNGKVSYLDVIVGLRDLLAAKIQMYTSYFDLRGELMRYTLHEGKLYESILEK